MRYSRKLRFVSVTFVSVGTQEPTSISSVFPLRNRLLPGLFPDRARLPDYPPYFLNSGSLEFGVVLAQAELATRRHDPNKTNLY